MTYAGRCELVLALVALVLVSVGALPNHLKAVVVDSDPVPVVVVKEPVVVVKEPVVSASGVYKAEAGQGGPGGLYAAADSPLGSASAGLGGGAGTPTYTVSSGHPGKPAVHQGPGLFDGIFNIPISVLQAVNTYLNNRGPITKPMVYRRRGHHPVVVDKTVTPQVQGETHAEVPAPEASSGSSASSSASASASASSSSSAASHPGQAQGPVVVHKRVNYDDIFNIPISVLKSVNHLLNG